MKEKNQNFFFELELETNCFLDRRKKQGFLNWNDFLMKYGLGDNKWLSGLSDVVNFSMCFACVVEVSDLGVFAEFFEDHHLWIPVYLDYHFWARMRSTQRSKSMPAFFNKERESDAADFHTIILCATKSSIEAQFQHVYIHEKFRKVQAQFKGKVNCITRSTHSTLGYMNRFLTQHSTSLRLHMIGY
ncbi:hypothetical protein Ahy_B10g104151 [Arachis hypogaea]|uniref:Protein FAR1-RELATED SEQUENCE n=1 Tax=Arachis hypogaea TaxID=3818 RepID=A0A444X4U5_ARAHY|nr:hypothetical protein Ahy_B10g104151 [Arachis hypogaea]